MSKLTFSVIEQKAEQSIYGLRCQASDKTQYKDIPSLAKKYYKLVNKKNREVIPFFVLSQNYDKQTKKFDLFIGGCIEHPELEMMVIRKGLYGRIDIKPKMGILWGKAISQAKKKFYDEWLPQSGYVGLNMEYEYHTQVSTSKSPQITLLFAIKKKTKSLFKNQNE